MLLSLILATILSDCSGMMFRKPGFSVHINEFKPTSIIEARNEAELKRNIVPYLPKIERMFISDETVPKLLGSIWLALCLDDQWLYVDQKGFARLGAQRGRFRIVDFQLLLQMEDVFNNWTVPPMHSFEIVNNSRDTVSLVDTAG